MRRHLVSPAPPSSKPATGPGCGRRGQSAHTHDHGEAGSLCSSRGSGVHRAAETPRHQGSRAGHTAPGGGGGRTHRRRRGRAPCGPRSPVLPFSLMLREGPLPVSSDKARSLPRASRFGGDHSSTRSPHELVRTGQPVPKPQQCRERGGRGAGLRLLARPDRDDRGPRARPLQQWREALLLTALVTRPEDRRASRPGAHSIAAMFLFLLWRVRAQCATGSEVSV